MVDIYFIYTPYIDGNSVLRVLAVPADEMLPVRSVPAILAMIKKIQAGLRHGGVASAAGSGYARRGGQI